MKRSLALATLMFAVLASAEPPESDTPDAKSAKALVQKQLLEPLAVKERTRGRLSRAALPPQARRVRMVDSRAVKDLGGHALMTFAIDARSGYALAAEDEGTWRRDTIIGCVYLETGAIFIKRGTEYRASGLLLGQKTEAAPEGICIEATGSQWTQR